MNTVGERLKTLRDVDAVAEHTGRTRNEVILKSIEFALRNLEIPEKK